jgi:hypothetical protein
VVHEARAGEIAREAFRLGFGGRRILAFLGQTAELTS